MPRPKSRAVTAHNGAKIRGERKEWPGNRLCCAVTRRKATIADPARTNKGLTQQRQHDVAATKDQCSRAIKCIE